MTVAKAINTIAGKDNYISLDVYALMQMKK